MLNTLALVGRLSSDLEIIDDNKLDMILAVPRAYKNMDGEYDIDNIPIRCWKPIATQTLEYCKKGDLIGIKGHIRIDDGETKIIAEKITVLKSNKKED